MVPLLIRICNGIAALFAEKGCIFHEQEKWFSYCLQRRAIKLAAWALLFFIGMPQAGAAHTLLFIAVFMWMRRYMLDQMTKDYISFARAKGLSNKKLMVRHVVRNAFVPIAQYLPASVLMTISGSIYVESLFSIPGMGGLLIAAIQRQDNPLVQALVLIYSSIGILGLLLGDLLMALCDPRIKLGGKGGAN